MTISIFQCVDIDFYRFRPVFKIDFKPLIVVTTICNIQQMYVYYCKDALRDKRFLWRNIQWIIVIIRKRNIKKWKNIFMLDSDKITQLINVTVWKSNVFEIIFTVISVIPWNGIWIFLKWFNNKWKTSKQNLFEILIFGSLYIYMKKTYTFYHGTI